MVGLGAGRAASDTGNCSVLVDFDAVDPIEVDGDSCNGVGVSRTSRMASTFDGKVAAGVDQY